MRKTKSRTVETMQNKGCHIAYLFYLDFQLGPLLRPVLGCDAFPDRHPYKCGQQPRAYHNDYDVPSGLAGDAFFRDFCAGESVRVLHHIVGDGFGGFTHAGAVFDSHLQKYQYKVECGGKEQDMQKQILSASLTRHPLVDS